MHELFSGDVDTNHYRGHKIIDCTQIDMPSFKDPETGRVQAFDWCMPDAMIVTFPETTGEKAVVEPSPWKVAQYVIQLRNKFNRGD